MTCYNDESFVGTAIESLLHQTFAIDTIIICDDCSTDSSWEILTEYKKKNPDTLVIAQNEKNMGTTATRNKLTTFIPKDTVYVVILDSDDIALPSRVEAQIKYLETNSSVSAVNSDIQIVDESNRVIGVKKHRPQKNLRRYALRWNPFAQSAMTLRWADWKSALPYDEALERGEDYDMWLKMLSNGQRIDIFPETLVQFRVHQGQGKWKKSQLSMRAYATVRLRYLFKKDFFSVTALLITAGYLVASLMPKRVMLLFYTKIYVQK